MNSNIRLSTLFGDVDDKLALRKEERDKSVILLIESEPEELQGMKDALVSLNFPVVIPVKDHRTGLQMLYDTAVTHVIMNTSSSAIDTREFVEDLIRIDKKLIILPSTYSIQDDDIFDFFCRGARGVIVKPCSAATMDQAIGIATHHPGFSEALLKAPDRNRALSRLLVDEVDASARAYRDYLNNRADESYFSNAVRRLATVCAFSQTFARGGIYRLLDAAVDIFIEISHGPATRLGRLRQRLSKQRDQRKVEDSPDV